MSIATDSAAMDRIVADLRTRYAEVNGWFGNKTGMTTVSLGIAKLDGPLRAEVLAGTRTLASWVAIARTWAAQLETIHADDTGAWGTVTAFWDQVIVQTGSDVAAKVEKGADLVSSPAFLAVVGLVAAAFLVLQLRPLRGGA